MNWQANLSEVGSNVAHVPHTVVPQTEVCKEDLTTLRKIAGVQVYPSLDSCSWLSVMLLSTLLYIFCWHSFTHSSIIHQSLNKSFIKHSINNDICDVYKIYMDLYIIYTNTMECHYEAVQSAPCWQHLRSSISLLVNVCPWREPWIIMNSISSFVV